MADPHEFVEMWAEVRAAHPELSNVVTAAKIVSSLWKRFIPERMADRPKTGNPTPPPSEVAVGDRLSGQPRAKSERTQSANCPKPFRAPASLAIH